MAVSEVGQPIQRRPLRKHAYDLPQRAQKFQQRIGTRLRFIDVNFVPAPVDHGNLGTWDRVADLFARMAFDFDVPFPDICVYPLVSMSSGLTSTGY
jgi:hypothetical protein